MPTPAQCVTYLEAALADLRAAATTNAAQQVQVENAIKAFGVTPPAAAAEGKPER